MADSEKAAKVIIDMVVAEEMPHRLILGSDAYPAIVASLDAQQSEYAKFEPISYSTDFMK